MLHRQTALGTALAFVLPGLAALGACKAKSEQAPASAERRSQLESATSGGSVAPAAPAVMAPEPAPAELADAPKSGKANYEVALKEEDAGESRAPRRKQDAPAEQPGRAWFPETFLFEPLVVTDDAGRAQISARVPDRLTTWRVLALAHSRTGGQAGAVTSFLGTLPAYVDPIVPKRLLAGDSVRIPLQLINTTDQPITAPLSVEATGVQVKAETRTITVPAGGSRLEYAQLTATSAGAATLRVTFGATDAVVRTLEITPAGRRVETTRTGTLGQPRELTVPGLAGATPATDHARLQVMPGALAILRTELGVCTARSGLAEDAYALLLAGRAPTLLTALGDRAEPEALRELALVASQRVLRRSRTLDVASATLIAEAALAHPQNAVLERLAARAGDTLMRAQLPDGTFAVRSGATLQHVLVTTAEAVRALTATASTPDAAQRAQAARVRAGGAFARSLALIDDPYTAAAILVSGAITDADAERLRERVRGALVRDEAGAHLPVPEGAVRGDGATPTRLEATALAALALAGDAKAPLADLGTTLLGSYSPAGGWGDGRTNLLALRAVLALFDKPIPAGVQISLFSGDRQVASGTLTADKLREVLVLEAPAPGLASEGRWRVVAEPAVPGLAFALTLSTYVPWQPAPVRGLELRTPATVRATVGKPVKVPLTAVAPSGQRLVVQYPLPAGVQADRQALEALRAAGTVASFTADDAAVELTLDALEPGQIMNLELSLIPTLAGTLHAGASSLTATALGEHHEAAPATWTVQ